MRFGKNTEEAGKSAYEKAILRLQEGNQEINISVDTQEKDGRFFLFNMETSEPEYRQFLENYNLALNVRNKSHEMAREEDLGMGA